MPEQTSPIAIPPLHPVINGCIRGLADTKKLTLYVDAAGNAFWQPGDIYQEGMERVGDATVLRLPGILAVLDGPVPTEDTLAALFIQPRVEDRQPAPDLTQRIGSLRQRIGRVLRET